MTIPFTKALMKSSVLILITKGFPSKPRQKLSTNMSEILFMNQYAHSSWNMSKNPSKTHTQNMDNWLIKETRRLSSAGKGFEWGIIEG